MNAEKPRVIRVKRSPIVKDLSAENAEPLDPVAAWQSATLKRLSQIAADVAFFKGLVVIVLCLQTIAFIVRLVSS